MIGKAAVLNAARMRCLRKMGKMKKKTSARKHDEIEKNVVHGSFFLSPRPEVRSFFPFVR